MKIIALIPSYGNREYLKDMLAFLSPLQGVGGNPCPVDDVITLIQEQPLGASNARRQLIEQAYAKHGENALYLMLDDDCVFTDNSKIRDAAKHFNELKGLGIVMIPTYLKEGAMDKYYDTVRAYHTFLISGKVLKAGLNYAPDEPICDELDLSLRVWLAGYRNIITYRAIIWHHVTKHNNPEDHGVTVDAINEGKLKMNTNFHKNFTGLFEYQSFNYLGVDIPNFFSVVPTHEATKQHDTNRKLIIN